MPESIEVSAVLPGQPAQWYRAWIDSREHGAITGAEAAIESRVGGRFSAWGGYIKGRTVVLEPFGRIVQAWRTTDFPEGSPDSVLEVLLEEVPEGTRITLKHSEIPDGRSSEYRQGWIDYYIQPMREYAWKRK